MLVPFLEFDDHIRAGYFMTLVLVPNHVIWREINVGGELCTQIHPFNEILKFVGSRQV